MIVRKEFECTTKDIDKVIVELANEIQNGWHIEQITDISYKLSCVLENYPKFSVILVRKNNA